MGTCVYPLFYFADYTKKLRECCYIRPVQRGGRTVNTDLINEQIPNGQYLIIDEQGNKLGLFDRNQALNIAADRDFDIFVVSPDSKPMVAKLMDYSKYRYDQQKKAREMKKNQQTVQIKEIRLSPTIDKHDFMTKVKHATKFLNSGDKVKLSMRFRGRMITHKDIGTQRMHEFISQLGELANVEARPKFEGNQLIAVIASAVAKP